MHECVLTLVWRLSGAKWLTLGRAGEHHARAGIYPTDRYFRGPSHGQGNL